jgi:indole-3-glycerol phosphate synthase
MGADAVLLIVSALGDQELVDLHTLAVELAMDALVEVHDRGELERALEVGAELIGVNQRDLRTFDVDEQRAAELAASMPSEVIAVAESGISGPDDAGRLADSGYQAILVGESLLRSPDRRRAVRELSGHRVGSRAHRAAAVGGSDSGRAR